MSKILSRNEQTFEWSLPQESIDKNVIVIYINK